MTDRSGLPSAGKDALGKELEIKLERLRKMMAANNAAVHLAKLGNLAWLLCGGDALVSFADSGRHAEARGGPHAGGGAGPARARSLPTRRRRPLLPLARPRRQGAAARGTLGGGQNIADTPSIAGAEVRDFWPLRVPLTGSEVARYSALGRGASQAFTETLETLTPGLSEHAVAARIACALREWGIQPALILVAADERLMRYRHPLPTPNVFEERVIIVTCARREGLYANLTRIVSAGALTSETRGAYQRLLGVESTLLNRTQHGVLARELFSEMQRAYDASGFEDEWARHYQGGPCGYETRDWVLQEGGEKTFQEGSAYAWNPSLPGLKVEDTVLLQGEALDILTADPSWPSVEVEGRMRPEVLEL